MIKRKKNRYSRLVDIIIIVMIVPLVGVPFAITTEFLLTLFKKIIHKLIVI